MKNAVVELPAGYAPLFVLDLQKNKKTALLVNLLAILIGLAMGVGMHFFRPINELFDFFDLGFTALRVGVLAVSSIAYIILHEAVHGITMKMCGCRKVSFGLTWLYAFAGTKEYLKKWPYLVVALSPIVVFFFIFFALCLLLPGPWFWVAYFLQIINISGAAGDLYVTLRFIRLPSDVYVSDTGTAMTVYQKEEK